MVSFYLCSLFTLCSSFISIFIIPSFSSFSFTLFILLFLFFFLPLCSFLYLPPPPCCSLFSPPLGCIHCYSPLFSPVHSSFSFLFLHCVHFSTSLRLPAVLRFLLRWVTFIVFLLFSRYCCVRWCGHSSHPALLIVGSQSWISCLSVICIWLTLFLFYFYLSSFLFWYFKFFTLSSFPLLSLSIFFHLSLVSFYFLEFLFIVGIFFFIFFSYLSSFLLFSVFSFY